MEKNLQVSVRSFSETDSEILNLIRNSTDGFIRKDGFDYLLSDNMIFSCKVPESGLSLFNLIRMANRPENNSDEFAWIMALKGFPDAELFRKHGIPDNIPRCILLFNSIQNNEFSLVSDIVPLDGMDRIIHTESGEICLVFHMQNRSLDDAVEYAAAVVETLESEAGFTCSVGIGRTVESFSKIHSSYKDARSAIELGMRHKSAGRVYAYDKLALERLADLISSEDILRFRNEMLPVRVQKALTGEILETVRVFFENDLNLSTTARQLFIHRNTLLYRMEKIKKLTGLDLRKFEDAVVFRFLMMISDSTVQTNTLEKEGRTK